MGGTLLLADDSITIQKVVELTFAETEHSVVAVGGGRDLFKRLPEVKPDVVLCDVVMPDVNGYEVCQTLKSDPATLHIPVVLLTGTFEPFDRDRALAAGCDAIVTKPFEARELIDVVEDLIKRARTIPAPAEAGGLDEHGIPEGVPALDFSTTGFDQLVQPPARPAAVPEDGIELTASSLGDSSPQVAHPAPPELQESAPPPAFAFGGEPEPPFAEPVVLTVSPPEEFAPEVAGGAPGAGTPARSHEPAAGEPFAAGDVEPAPLSIPPVPEALESAAVFTAEELDSLPTPVAPFEERRPQEPAVPLEPPAVAGAAAPAGAGSLSEDDLERIARRAAALVPPPPAPPTAADLLTDEHVQHIAMRAAALVPPPPAPPTAAELLTDEHVQHIAARAAALVPPPQAPPTAADLLTDEHVQHIAARAAALVPPPPAPPTAEDLLTDEHVQHIATRAAALVPPPQTPPTAADLLTDEHVQRIATRAAELLPAQPAEPRLTDDQVERIAQRVVELAAPALERIAWEVIPDMAEMLVRKRIAELEAAAEEEGN
jgi:CheY-like chemotaxis protein